LQAGVTTQPQRKAVVVVTNPTPHGAVVVSDTRQAQSAQATSSTVCSATGQREWIEHFLPFATKNKYPATVISIAWAMFEFYFNRRTGQCDPGLDDLAATAGCSLETAKRGSKLMQDDGWLQVKRGAPGTNAQLTPTISDRTTSVLSVRREQRAEVSLADTSAEVSTVDTSARTPEVSKSVRRSVKVGLQKCHHADTSKLTLNTEHSAPSRARSALSQSHTPVSAVRESDVTESSSLPGKSAPDGALPWEVDPNWDYLPSTAPNYTGGGVTSLSS
jgi:hypothetical protein